MGRPPWPPPGLLLWTQRRANPQTRPKEDTTLNQPAQELYDTLKEKEEAENIPIHMQLELRRILFKKKR